MKEPTADWRDNLKVCMEQQKIKAVQLSEKTGLSNSTISNYLRKKRENICEEHFNLIAETLGVHPAVLRYGVDFSINIPFYMQCHKAILAAAKKKSQHLSESQKILSTAHLYNMSNSSRTEKNMKAADIIDIIAESSILN